MTIFATDTQRNGMTGEAFLSAIISINDGGTRLVLTMGYYADGTGRLNPTTCRVVNPFDLADAYRGDDIGADFIESFNV